MKQSLFSALLIAAAGMTFAVGLGGVAHAVAVPELDPGTANSGVALLIGGALLLIERYRRR